jgi:hypothetical protein
MGADTSAFRPAVGAAPPFARDPSRIWCVFAGAFRRWHGAALLAAALKRLHAAGDQRFAALFIGDGPERAATERAAAGLPAVRSRARSRTPICRGISPQVTSASRRSIPPGMAAQLGFYWSPEGSSMACGLPVVAPRLPV